MLINGKKFKITNTRGDSISFGRHFKIPDDFELSGLEADVVYSETPDDGSSYQNTVLANRPLDIRFFIERNNRNDEWIEGQRILANNVFNPKLNPFKIEFSTKGGSDYYLNANLEASPVFGHAFGENNRLWLSGLLKFSANDPYIYKKHINKVDIATWIGNLEFPLEIPPEGIEMGYRTKSLIKNAFNDGSNDTGMIIRFTATGTASTPKLININTYEELTINFDMIAGDVIEVNTIRGNKSAVLIRNNVVTKMLNIIDINSTFLQLKPGDNVFRYEALEGNNNVEVSLLFASKSIGV